MYSSRTIPAIAAAAALFTATQAAAQPAPEPGPHAVGFRVIEARDSTRAYRPARDWTGARAGDTSRPVRISVWYPAQPAPGTPAMTLGDFQILARDEFAGAPPASPEVRERAREALESLSLRMGDTEEAAAALWDSPTAARRDAPHLPGPFPLVLYFTSAGSGNPGLADHLASHGFVVASFPSNGRMTETPIEFTPNPLSLDTDVDDAGFVLSVLRRMPWIDGDRVAAVAFSSGSLSALLWQMRDMQASALVTMEGWERYRRGAEIVRASPHYDPDRVRVPLLLLERAADEASPAYARVPFVVDSLRHADVRRVAFRDAAHVDFMSQPTGRVAPEVFPAAARMVELFLRGAVRGDAVASATLAALTPDAAGAAFTAGARAAEPPAPTEEELFRLAELDPAGAARVFAATRPGGRPPFRAHVLSRAAIFAATPEDRAIVLRMVVDAWPASVDARFRHAEALIAAGRISAAEAALRQAAERIDADASLDAEGRAAWRSRIDARIAGLRGGG